MKGMVKIAIAVAIVLAGLGSIAWSNSESDDVVKAGDQLPEFSLTNEQKVISTESLKGKVVMINFFATWCPPCVKELPHLQSDIWEPYKSNKDFVLLVVGREHSAKEIASFAEKRGLDLPFYPDSKREVYSKFATQTIPRNYIINREGEIIYGSTGYNESEFNKIKAILKKELN